MDTEPLVPLTPQQIQNWRNQLALTIGPYALIMPEADVEKHRALLVEKLKKPTRKL